MQETRGNIKIESHPFYHMICDWFSWGWSKKKIKMEDPKKLSFSKSPIHNIFWRFWKFFWVGHFDFCFIPMKISHKLCVRIDGSQLLWLWWFTTKNDPPQTLIVEWQYPFVYKQFILWLMRFQVTIISLLTTSCWWRWYNASWWVSIGARFQGTVSRGIRVLFNLPFRVKIFTHSKRTSCALPKQRSGVQNVSKQVCTD